MGKALQRSASIRADSGAQVIILRCFPKAKSKAKIRRDLLGSMELGPEVTCQLQGKVLS